MDDAVDKDCIQELGGAVHQVGNIDRYGSQLAVRDCSCPKGAQAFFTMEARNQGLDFIHGLYRVAVQLNTVFDFQDIEFRPVALQPVPNRLNGIDADIAMDESAA